jgi:hypothetical protein
VRGREQATEESESDIGLFKSDEPRDTCDAEEERAEASDVLIADDSAAGEGSAPSDLFGGVGEVLCSTPGSGLIVRRR